MPVRFNIGIVKRPLRDLRPQAYRLAQVWTRRRAVVDGHVVTIGRYSFRVLGDEPPHVVRERLLDDVLSALNAAGVTAFVIPSGWTGPHRVGVPAERRSAAVAALAEALEGPACYCRVERRGRAGGGRPQPLDRSVVSHLDEAVRSVTIARFHATADATIMYRFDQGCCVEFWAEAPATAEDAAPVEITVRGRRRLSIALFRNRSLDALDEIPFPIDAIYTWVDNSDPAWLTRMQQARAELADVELHDEATSPHRFLDRDELRYSLRSLEHCAPWIRHVYLITDGQSPAWLRADHPRLTVVDHRQVFRDPSALPVFNSNAITTQLHNIDGLAEHYLYLNDDTFFGRELSPAAFWYPSGVAKVFPSPTLRPRGDPDPRDLPHVNITRNIRALLERELGVTVSHAIRHTPHPQRRSIHRQLDELFRAEIDRTMHSKFRHHLDIAQDQLFHYYAQAIGAAVPAEIPYCYVDLADAADRPKLDVLLYQRPYDVFCLNDAPASDAERIADDEIRSFLTAYFPLPSSFERTES